LPTIYPHWPQTTILPMSAWLAWAPCVRWFFIFLGKFIFVLFALMLEETFKVLFLEHF
jgi:hypothetical protein